MIMICQRQNIFFEVLLFAEKNCCKGRKEFWIGDQQCISGKISIGSISRQQDLVKKTNELNNNNNTMPESEADKWLAKIQQEKKGKLKIYIGMSAGVGKTYRMLQEAHTLLRNGVNVKIGYIETHGRKETQALDRRIAGYSKKKSFL